MAIKTEQVTGPNLHGTIARPAAGSHAGVLLLPTIYGVNTFAAGYAELLAEAGLVAAVWDIHSGLPLTTDYKENIGRVGKLTDPGVADMLAGWIDHMLTKLDVSTFGVLGFCIGGRLALLTAAADKRTAACVPVYPSIHTASPAPPAHNAVALAAEIACPVHLVQPGNDRVTSPETYAALRHSLQQRTAPTIVQDYPQAEHGFMHLDGPIANVAATAIASPQVVAFLKACLH